MILPWGHYLVRTTLYGWLEQRSTLDLPNSPLRPPHPHRAASGELTAGLLSKLYGSFALQRLGGSSMSVRQSDLTVAVDLAMEDSEQLDELVLSLCDELRLLEIGSVRRVAAGDVPPGTRGVPAESVSCLILSGAFSAGTLGALTRLLIEWIRRCGARSVVLDEDGDRLELHGLTRSDQQELISAWISRRAGAGGAAPSADAARRAPGETDG